MRIIKNEDALISVIIPVYNVEKWLRHCVESVLNQTYKNLEIILVDDGSTDHCGQICDQFAKQDCRVVVIHRPNGGLSEARNTGLDIAHGIYISFVDSDDWIEQDMLETLLCTIKEKNAEISVCNYIREYETLPAKTIHPDTYQIRKDMIMSGRDFIRMEICEKPSFCVVVWNKLYKREIFETLRFPAGKIHEDAFVFHEIIYPCLRIACLSYVGYHYLIRNNSIMGSGGNSIHRVEPLINRCMYFNINKDDEMLLLGERELAREIKRGGSRGDLHEIRDLMDKSYHISKLLYQKNMISFWKLVQRKILYYGFYPVITEARKGVWKIRARSCTFNHLWCWMRDMIKGA